MPPKSPTSELNQKLRNLLIEQDSLLAEKEAMDRRVATTTSSGIMIIRLSVVAGALCLALIGWFTMPALLPELRQAAQLGALFGVVLGALSIGGLVAIPIDKKAFPLLEQQESVERQVREVEIKIKSVEQNLEGALSGFDGKELRG